MDMDVYPCVWSFESDVEDWTPFGLMDPTMEEDISTPEEATAVREFVQAYNTASPVPADEAARRLMSLTEDRISCDGPLDKGERVCWMMWDVVLTMPQHQTAILVLIDAVRALPRLDATPEQEARFRNGNKLELWRKLFKWTEIESDVIEALRQFRYRTEQPDSLSRDYVRACALIARKLVLHPPDLNFTLELQRAIWQIQFTLEQDAIDWPTPPEEDHEMYIFMLNANVMGIIPYLKIAGHIIYKYLDREALWRRFAETHQENHEHNTREFWERIQSKISPRRRSVPGCRDARLLWQGDVWLTRDRWAFWKQRLVWISEHDELLQRTRDQALMLVQLMQEIETREA